MRMNSRSFFRFRSTNPLSATAAMVARAAVALTIVLGLVAASRGQSPQLAQKSPDAAEIISTVQSKVSARVIVQYQALQSQARATIGTTAENIAAGKSENRQTQ